MFLAEFFAEKDGEMNLAGIFPGKIIFFDLKDGEELFIEHFVYLGLSNGMLK